MTFQRWLFLSILSSCSYLITDRRQTPAKDNGPILSSNLQLKGVKETWKLKLRLLIEEQKLVQTKFLTQDEAWSNIYDRLFAAGVNERSTLSKL